MSLEIVLLIILALPSAILDTFKILKKTKILKGIEETFRQIKNCYGKRRS